VDLNHRPLGYEPNELPDCSTPHEKNNTVRRSTIKPGWRFVSAQIVAGQRG
jgi:hypothetical protein